MSTGNFIASAARAGQDPGGPASYLRREFDVRPGLRRATLHVSAVGLIEPYLNGVRVGQDVLIPGWTSYKHRVDLLSYDVTELIIEGRNAVGAILGDGWAVGRLTGDAGKRHVWTDRPACYMQLELSYDERTEVVNSDGLWRAATGAVVANGIYDGEHFDARLDPVGWNRPGFVDTGWSTVDLVDWPVLPQSTGAPPIRRTEQLPPARIFVTPAGRTVVDFGQVLTGWVRIRITGTGDMAGETIALRHFEALFDGEPDYRTNRSAQATDRYTPSGNGTEAWEPSFTFHGFRYVDVEGWPGVPDASDVTAVVVHSDMQRIGWFESSDELLNQLHRNVVWSMRGNFVGIPTDCPQRDERLGWTGDINAFAPTAAYLYDVRGVLESWLRDLSAEQCEKGFVPFVVPDALGTFCPPTALWGDVSVSLPWTLYQEYGDPQILERQYPSMHEFVASVETALDSSGLWNSGFQFGDWLDPDAPTSNPAGGKTDPAVVATAYLCKVADEMRRIAQVLGKADDEAHYAALHERVRTGFRHEWVSPAGLLVNESATAYSLAICFGLLDDDQQSRAGRRLAHLLAKSDFRISTGFAGTPLLAHALSQTDQLNAAYRLLLQTRCPSFLYPVTQGATTVWERWDAILPDGTLNDSGMTSLNHYALGAIANWLHRVVAGLAPAEPGYRVIEIAPRPGGGLTHASTTHLTPYGRAMVGWTIRDGEITVRATIPEGSEARVVLPQHPDGLVDHVGSGQHSWQYRLPAVLRRRYNLETRLTDLQADEEVWRAVAGVFIEHFPEYAAAFRGEGGSSGGVGNSLRDVLVLIPGDKAALESDLVAALDMTTS